MTETLYHPTTPEAVRRKELAPGVHAAFENFSHAVFADGALPERTKELIAVAVAHITQWPYCINGHTRRARRKGASPAESMEATIRVSSGLPVAGAEAVGRHGLLRAAGRWEVLASLKALSSDDAAPIARRARVTCA